MGASCRSAKIKAVTVSRAVRRCQWLVEKFLLGIKCLSPIVEL